MLIEDYREKIIKLNESLEFLKYRDENRQSLTVYKRPELKKSWDSLYNNNPVARSTMNKIYYYQKRKEIKQNFSQKYKKRMKKNFKDENKDSVKIININLFENDGHDDDDNNFSLPKITIPAVKISLVSKGNNKKLTTEEVLKGLKGSKRPKKLSLTDLVKIKMDKKKAFEAKNLYFQASTNSFVPAIAINKWH
jgi:hypothetical protein